MNIALLGAKGWVGGYMYTLSELWLAQPGQKRGEVWRRVTMVALFLNDKKTNDDGDGDGDENGQRLY